MYNWWQSLTVYFLGARRVHYGDLFDPGTGTIRYDGEGKTGHQTLNPRNNGEIISPAGLLGYAILLTENVSYEPGPRSRRSEDRSAFGASRQEGDGWASRVVSEEKLGPVPGSESDIRTEPVALGQRDTVIVEVTRSRNSGSRSITTHSIRAGQGGSRLSLETATNFAANDT